MAMFTIRWGVEKEWMAATKVDPAWWSLEHVVEDFRAEGEFVWRQLWEGVGVMDGKHWGCSPIVGMHEEFCKLLEDAKLELRDF